MAVQQCRSSKRRTRLRAASKRYRGMQTNTCSCGAVRRPHCVCTGCGKYKDRQYITIISD
jgi:ribosomal protein L32